MTKARAPIKEKSATGDASRGKSAKPSLMQQAINVFLPIAVVSLFLWWFCTIPPSGPAPTLPANWTPECDEWKSEWQIFPAESGVFSVRIAHVDAPRDRLVLIADHYKGPRDHVMTTITDGRELARVPIRDGSWCFLGQDIYLLADYSQSAWPEIESRDVVDFSLVQRIVVNSTPALQPGGEVSVRAIAMLPDNSLRAVVVITESQAAPTAANPQHRSVKSFQAVWLDIDPAGSIRQLREIDGAGGGIWSTDSVGQPQHFVDWTGRAGIPQALRCIEVATGAPSAVPPEAAPPVEGRIFWDENPEVLPRLAPTPAGRTPLASIGMDNRLPLVATELSVSSLLESGAQGAKNRSMVYAMLKFRRELWQWRYGTAGWLRVRTLRTQVDALVLHPTSVSQEGSRVLTGDLVTTVAHEFHHETRRSMEAVAPLTGPALPISGVSVFAIPDNRYLVVQVMRNLPDSPSAPTMLLRLGVIDAQATTVRWLGWKGIAIAETKLGVPLLTGSVDVYRVENQFLIAARGSSPSPSSVGQMKAGLAWITIPLPAELTDLPEGPL